MPSACIDRDSAANTCRDAANDETCPSEPTTRVDISSVCANAVDQHHCPANAVDQHHCPTNAVDQHHSPANAVDQHRCDSDVDALLSGLLGDRKSETDSSLARSHSSIKTRSIDASNAGSIGHQLIRASLAPTTRAVNSRGVNVLPTISHRSVLEQDPSLSHAVILQDSLHTCSQQMMLP